MKYYTKEVAKALTVISFGLMIILTVVFIKYKPAYEVSLAGKSLGYIGNKDKIELKIKKYIEDTSGNIAFKEQKETPVYELKFISRGKQTQEKEVLLAVKDATVTTYRTYAVTVDGEVKTTVASEAEAINIVDTLKSDVDANLIGLNIGIVENYTTDLNLQTTEEASGILNNIKVAKITEYNTKQEEIRKKDAKKKTFSGKQTGALAGITLTKPVNGSITSRYGVRSRIRSGAHTGLDIATSSGTPITTIAPGTVTYAGYKGSYGYLVIVDHGNGIESYYAHCSKIYTAVGQKVENGTVISAVGSTGNSTGPHLHLEIRKNGSTLNPQNYLY